MEKERMVKVTPLDEAKRNYNAGAAGAGTKYRDAVSRTTDWAEKAGSDAAENLYAQKTQEAIAAKRRKNAVSQVSNEDWKRAAMDKGSQRISQGMQAAQDDWAEGFSPFKSALEGVTLPDRTADPVANVTGRVIPIVQALANKKKELKG